MNTKLVPKLLVSRILFELGRFQNIGKYYSVSVRSFELSTKIQSEFIQDNIVVFESYQGRQYACSPKAIYEHMLKHEEFDNFNFVWVFKNPDNYSFLLKNPRTVLVKYNSWEATKYFRKAKYWIVNFRVPLPVIKMSDQVMVQCWHGTPFKKIGLDINVSRNGAVSSLDKIAFDYQLDAKKYDFFISPSRFASEKFISAFNLENLGKTDIILESGYPRNDFLINHTHYDVQKIKERLKIPEDKKVILHAPTWRDDQYILGRGYQFDFFLEYDKLKRELDNNYVILFRTHYLISKAFDFSAYSGFIYDVSQVDDINELYIISDVLITDYSSVFFDFANLVRPILFYMPDYENYKHNLRDFYLALDDLPGPVFHNQQDLVKELVSLPMHDTEYRNKITAFNRIYNYLEDGKASERVVKTIFHS
jgi:CDP-glycerol glycerophosphotransferase